MSNFAIAPPGQPDVRVIDNTTTNLTNTATYTSNGYRIGGWDRIVVGCFSDQAGTIFVDQSPDGTNWDITSSTGVTASTGQAFSVDLVETFARVRFTNSGGSTQTAFRMQTSVKTAT